MRACIILAGGMGTRLRSVVAELPKCMAPVNGKPFLFYIFKWLKKNNFSRVILSLGYMPDAVLNFLKEEQWPFEIVTEIEAQPMGTGGAIALSLSHCNSSDICILNGDTFFDIDIDGLYAFHQNKHAALTIAAKPLTQYDRYGSLLCENDGRITGFTEKQKTKSGIINGGIYLMHVPSMPLTGLPQKFSFEKEILEKEYSTKPFFAFKDNGYFIDIGIPEDYYKAGEDFKKMFP